MDETWKDLLEQARQRDLRSPYGDRLKAVASAKDANASLAGEILEEMARSLARAGSKVDAELLALDLLADQIDKAPEGSPTRAILTERFNQGRERAERARRDLLIQREAIGFRNNLALAGLYPIPPKR